MTWNDLLFPLKSGSNIFHQPETSSPFPHQKRHPELQAVARQPRKPTSVSGNPSSRNKEEIQNIPWAPARTRRQPRRPPYPIWRLVEGACVMTELDWGDGMACWITTLVSWLGIRVLPSWWAPGPAMAPPTVLCIEMFCPEKTERKGQKKSAFYSQALKGPNWESGHVNLIESYGFWQAMGSFFLLQLTAMRRWKITLHPKSKAHKKIPWSSLITLPPSWCEVYIRDV